MVDMDEHDQVAGTSPVGRGDRQPAVSAISSDGGQTWKHLELL